MVEGYPIIELSSSASEPVGGVIPVFVKRRCTNHCGWKSYQLTRSEVAARNEAGEYVPALPDSEASNLAGGTQKLLDALGSRESNAGFLLRKGAGEYSKSGEKLGPAAVIGLPFIIGQQSYLAANPEKVLELRLHEISIPETREEYQHDGWVFFPIGKYTELQATYVWAPHADFHDQRSQIVRAPWNGSSTTIASVPAAGD